jgi:MoxR-like ATPase
VKASTINTSSGEYVSNIRFEEASLLYERILYQVKQVIVGQEELIRKIFLSILIGGHCLLESPPGLAKTLLMKTLASVIKADYKRIQGTPDLMPSDLIGMQIYNPGTHSFSFNPGPIFANLVLVDEINRTTPKVQSALLEAMQEKQVTVAGETHKLSDLFTVLATQNPLEYEGTYPLPEAQLDRFTFKLLVDYPDIHQEESIVLRFCISPQQARVEPICTFTDLMKLRRLIDQVFVEPEIIRLIVQIVHATRRPREFGLPELEDKLEHGASPRASIILTQACKGMAILKGRGYVLLEDLQDIALDVLRHRIHLSYKASLENIKPDDLIKKIIHKLLTSKI